MDPEWWLIDEATQNAIADRIDAAAAHVVDNFDNHGNENSLTAALGHTLLTTEIRIPDATVRFGYRNFSERDEEPRTGADGGFLVTVRGPEETIKKAVLFQAKRFPQDHGVKSLTLRHPKRDA
jgi:hypothetical protein